MVRLTNEVTVTQDLPEEQLAELLALQDVDTRIGQLEHKLDALPEQQALDDARERRTKAVEAHDALRVDLDRVRAENRRIEKEIDLLRQRRDAEQSRMYGGEISNPKELQSLRAEIESTERRIGDHEDQLLEVMETLEGLETRGTDLEQERDELDQTIERLEQERDDAAKELLAELGERRAERDRHREQLAEDLLQRYESARRNTKGVVVGELSNGMCTACRIELPIAEVNELYDGPPLAPCPNCQRMLVIR